MRESPLYGGFSPLSRLQSGVAGYKSAPQKEQLLPESERAPQDLKQPEIMERQQRTIIGAFRKKRRPCYRLIRHHKRYNGPPFPFQPDERETDESGRGRSCLRPTRVCRCSPLSVRAILHRFQPRRLGCGPCRRPQASQRKKVVTSRHFPECRQTAPFRRRCFLGNPTAYGPRWPPRARGRKRMCGSLA